MYRYVNTGLRKPIIAVLPLNSVLKQTKNEKLIILFSPSFFTL
jgi:hypothetical protein